jgi:uracil-DNA glycosylase
MPETLDGAHRTLFLSIARCQVIRDQRSSAAPASPCSKIVALQAARPLSHHIAEPWVGHLERAPLLFVGSNPGWSDDEHGLGADDDDELIDVFINFFGGGRRTYSVGGIRGVDEHGVPDRRWVRYWAFARQRARELLASDVVPGETYALTEVVHCNSRTEAAGAVWEALPECSARFLDSVLAASGARVVIVVGAIAAAAFRARALDPDAGVLGPVDLAGRQRMIVFLPHPNRRGGPKTVGSVAGAGLERLRAFATGGEE